MLRRSSVDLGIVFIIWTRSSVGSLNCQIVPNSRPGDVAIRRFNDFPLVTELRLYPHHYFARHVPALLQPVSLGQLVQGEDAADVRFQLSFVRKLRDRAEDFTLSLEMNAVNSRRAHELKIKRGILAKE